MNCIPTSVVLVNMNNYLADVGVNLHAQFRCTAENNTYDAVYDMECSNDDVIFTTIEVTRIVKNIDIHKSSGIDFLPTFVMKDSFGVIIDQLTYMFNQSMKLGVFPTAWKVATITPIPKTGDCTVVGN